MSEVATEESMSGLLNWRRFARTVACGAAALALSAGAALAQSGEPIKIGFSMSLTGPLSANGKMSLVAMKIWEDDTNKAGGLLGRPVKLIYYDDQSSPAQVPNSSTSTRSISRSAPMPRRRSRRPCRS
jgi:branched-chain amino acid transport system substrate-binding protein